MTYLVVFTFDVININTMTSDIYELLNEQLSNIGLRRYLRSSKHNIVNLPNNTCAGEFKGASAQKICDDLFTSISDIFQENRINSQIFLTVGGDSWAWRSRIFNFS